MKGHGTTERRLTSPLHLCSCMHRVTRSLPLLLLSMPLLQLNMNMPLLVTDATASSDREWHTGRDLAYVLNMVWLSLNARWRVFVE